MEKTMIILLVLAAVSMISSSGCISDPESSNYDVVWIGEYPDEHVLIEDLMVRQMEPYPGIQYDNVTARASAEDGSIRIKVATSSQASEYMDLYDFVYIDDELIRTGYLLEAIPEPARDRAIDIATRDVDAGDLITSTSGPFVRRILPHTAEKFYCPKPLISVTWMDVPVSVLIDLETREVVGTWQG